MEHFLKEEKKQFRKQMLLKRDRLSQKSIQAKSMAIWQNLSQTAVYKNADVIFSYVSVKTEAQTIPFFEKMWEDGKKIAVPVTENNRIMTFVLLNDKKELTQIKWGIPEPKKEESTVMLPDEKSIFLVPAVAMDKRGNRIGYGGGYYDTYFEKQKKGCKIGYLFQMQVVKHIYDIQPTDIALDGMVTECGICFFRGGCAYE